MVAQYHKKLETLFGFFLNEVRAMTASKISSGSGSAARLAAPGFMVREYGVPAAPSLGISGFYRATASVIQQPVEGEALGRKAKLVHSLSSRGLTVRAILRCLIRRAVGSETGPPCTTEVGA